MDVFVTSKTKEDSNKNEGARVAKIMIFQTLMGS